MLSDLLKKKKKMIQSVEDNCIHLLIFLPLKAKEYGLSSQVKVIPLNGDEWPKIDLSFYGSH